MTNTAKIFVSKTNNVLTFERLVLPMIIVLLSAFFVDARSNSCTAIENAPKIMYSNTAAVLVERTTKHICIQELANSKMFLQNLPHVKFMGIPLNGSIDAFQQKLSKKGIRVEKLLNHFAEIGTRVFSGSFAGKQCTIFVYYTKDKTVYEAKAVYHNEIKSNVDDFYTEITSMLKEKYPEDEQNAKLDTETANITYEVYLRDSFDRLYGGILVYKTPEKDGLTSAVHIDYIDSANLVKNTESKMDDL